MIEPTRHTSPRQVVGLYRWREGARFDHQYYQHQHAALARPVLDPCGLIYMACDHVPTHQPTPVGALVALSVAHFPDLATSQAALRRAGPALAADVRAYTNIQPDMPVVHSAPLTP